MTGRQDKTCHPQADEPETQKETPVIGGDRRFGGYLYDIESSVRARD